MIILVVDDEPAIVTALTPVLAAQGYEVSSAETIAAALSAARRSRLDVVLLDLGLPDGDGIDIIAQLRKLTGASVIVLSARHQEEAKIAALDGGADDYVDKPFAIGELLARLRVVQRRREIAAGNLDEEFVSDQLYVHFTKYEVRLMGEEVKLSPKEFALLEELCRNCGHVTTHRKLLIAGWNDPDADGQYLRSYIALLREKLEADPSEPELIITAPGLGYRLAALDGADRC